MTLVIMDETAIKMRQEYLRNWRANNKDKVKEYNKRYWQKRAEKHLQEQAEQNAKK